MSAPNQRSSEISHREEFQHSLYILGEINSWQLWSGVLMLVLLPVAIFLLTFQSLFAPAGSPQGADSSGFVRGCLFLAWALSGFTLYHQRRRLKLLRDGLIEQTDAATKNRVRADKFYGLSILDPLTGLYNRRFGEARLQEEIGRAEESDDPLLVMAMDFDRFKQINDVHGHGAGDLALKEFSRRLQRAIRACDVPVRVGGDEFLVILPDCPPDKIQTILSRMGSIELNVDGAVIPVFFSHGMTQFRVNDTIETIIGRADEQLYAEKAKRKAALEAEQAAASNSNDGTGDLDLGSNALSDLQYAGATSTQRVRRSNRVSKEVAVFLIGSDLEGRVFTEKTNTVDLSRHGAGIVSRHKLAPDQEIIIRCLDTNKESEVRIVRVIDSQGDLHTYGLGLLTVDNNFWGVDIPVLPESEEDDSYVLYECRRCKCREWRDRRGCDSSASVAHQAAMRPCKRCGSQEFSALGPTPAVASNLSA